MLLKYLGCGVDGCGGEHKVKRGWGVSKRPKLGGGIGGKYKAKMGWNGGVLGEGCVLCGWMDGGDSLRIKSKCHDFHFTDIDPLLRISNNG